MNLPAWVQGTARCAWTGRVKRVEGAQDIMTPHGSLTHTNGRCDREGTIYAPGAQAWFCARHIMTKQANG